MSISAALVKELRERTGAGMMECKRALMDARGDMDLAVANMRKAGLAKADKKAGRIAAEGRITLEVAGDIAAMVEVNCETDFVANGEDFAAFITGVVKAVLTRNPADLTALGNLPFTDGKSVDTKRRELVAKIGENISVRRFARYMTNGGLLGAYSHGTRIGVLVEMRGGTAVLARDIAMHVAASKPLCVQPQQVSAALLDKEREIIRAQSADSGKPAAIIEKMVEGRLQRFFSEVTLLGQPFVKAPDLNVAKVLARDAAEVLRFTRFEVGEGIERKQDDFAAEVLAQARGA
ncbi:MAG: elongation factor Ts [Gammaproteobacteria bacterium]|nr:elongation factor Ts [Gammaproteobacteria bacterium]